MKTTIKFVPLAAAIVLGGCSSIPAAREAIFDAGGTVHMRACQERAFDASDRLLMLRAILTTLLELGFVIDRADANLGIVTATKLDTYTLRATVTVRRRGSGQLVVRANAQHAMPRETGGAQALDDPAAFQEFFAALSKTMFRELPGAG